MLYLVATPIGNLGDMSNRGVETLKKCDYILAEDTRHSKILLKHFDIETPLKSFHQFNEAKREEAIVNDLKEGQEIALITDAGTPGIQDPGERLVKRCHEEGVEVTSVGGPSAFLLALIQSGLSLERFQFVGFLPKKEGQLEKALEEYLSYPGTTVAYESPNRIVKVLLALKRLAPSHPVVIFKELSKRYETRLAGEPEKLLSHFEKHAPKGEFVLVFEQAKLASTIGEESYAERLDFWLNEGLTKKEALKEVAKEADRPKKEVYRIVYGSGKESS